MTYQELYQSIKALLDRSGVTANRGTPESESEQILLHAQKRHDQVLDRGALFSRIRQEVPTKVETEALRWAELRAKGLPLQQILGTTFFWEHEYKVTRDVLSPRPETEILVEIGSDYLRRHFKHLNQIRGLEIGLGSGVISIELLFQFPRLLMFASEVSPAAARVAKENAQNILGQDVSRLEIVPAQTPEVVLQPFLMQKPFDFLISNPPYLARDGVIDPAVVEYEPAEALFAPQGKDPDYFYKEIALRARQVLVPGAPVMLEIPQERTLSIQAIFESCQWKTEIFPDLNGLDRVLVAK